MSEPVVLDETVQANMARHARLEELAREAFSYDDPLSAEAFRTRVRLTALALDIPEEEIDPLLKGKPRLSTALPLAKEREVSLDWLFRGDIAGMPREISALRKRKMETTAA